MQNLICSMAGKSSRFKDTRPKGLLTHPFGYSMITASLKELVSGNKYINWDNIYIVYVKSQMDLKISRELYLELEKEGIEVKFIELPEYTNNQPNTIYDAIKIGNIEGSIFIKDCDNQFSITSLPTNSNGVAVFKLGNDKMIAGNKSYVQFDQLGNINNIVEKQIVSDVFCCGGYYFRDVNEFCKSYEKLSSEKNLYISHIIFDMIINGSRFAPINSSNYIDWGTLEDWLDYTKQFRTIFVDLDGIIFKNAGKLTTPNWNESEVILENINILKELDSSKTTLIATSSRPESMKINTLGKLKALGLNFKYSIFGLPHCKRILINDFAKTNPYPSAIAINSKRDDELISLKGL